MSKFAIPSPEEKAELLKEDKDAVFDIEGYYRGTLDDFQPWEVEDGIYQGETLGCYDIPDPTERAEMLNYFETKLMALETQYYSD